MNPFVPLRDRDFRFYFAGEALSFFGSGLSLVALNWYLLDRTGSASAVGAYYGVALSAGLVAYPLSGPVADRFPRRVVAIAADLVRLVSLGSLATLSWFGDPPLLAIDCSAFVTGLGFALFFPAIIAFLQEIVAREHLVAANGLSEVTMQLGNVSGAAAAGVALEHLGLAAVLTIDAGTYAVSALALGAVRHRSVPEAAHAPIGEMLREGGRYLRSHPAVAAFGVVSIVPTVATITANVVVVTYVQRVLHRGATVYGVADMMYGVGALAAGFLAALVVLRLGEWAAMGGLLVSLVAGYVAFMLEPHMLVVVFAITAAIGFCSSAFRVTANATLMRIVPGAVMGRTAAAFGISTTLLQVASAIAIGPLIENGGARAGFVLLAGLILAATLVLAAVAPRLRRPLEVA
jgi:MFS family permease